MSRIAKTTIPPVVFTCLLLWMLFISYSPAPLRAADKYFPDVVHGTPEVVFPGVKFWRAVDESRHWYIYILEVELDNPNVQVQPLDSVSKCRETTSEQAKAAGAVAALNGSFFDMNNGQHMGFYKVDGQVARTYMKRWFAFGTGGIYNNMPAITRVARDGSSMSGDPSWPKMLNALGAGPNLVTDGKIDYDQVNGDEFGWEKVTAQRTWLGYKTATRTLYFLAVDGRVDGPVQRTGMTCLEEAQFLLDLGCDQGLNYDGGGSTTLWVNGRVKNYLTAGAERAVGDVWVILPANIVDNLARECIKTGASWTEKKLPDSYYLDSIVLEGGDPSTSVTWRPMLAKTGEYDVYVWNPKDENQSDEATYTILDGEGSHDATIDPRENGGRWNRLGSDSYCFFSGSGGSVRLLNTAPSQGYTVADAVKFFYIGPRETIIDNTDRASTEADGVFDASERGRFIGDNYLLADSGEKKRFSWIVDPDVSGEYEVYAFWWSEADRADKVRYTITSREGVSHVVTDQKKDGGAWRLLGTYTFLADKRGRVTVNCEESSGGEVAVDAVKYVLKGKAEAPVNKELEKK